MRHSKRLALLQQGSLSSICNVTAVQTNAVPIGGPTAQQPVQPVGQLTPQDISTLVEQLTPAAARFRQQSSLLRSTLQTANYTQQGDDQTIRIASVGLGLMVESHHHLVVTLSNTAVGAQAFSVSPDFPYNFLSTSQIAINGGATVYNASGKAGLQVWMRNRRGMGNLNQRGGFGPGLSPAIVNVTVGANGTPTNSANATFPAQLSGITQISVAGASTCQVTIDFITFEKLVLDMESMLGALPLQNNATYATLERILVPAFLGTTQVFPFFISGSVPTTATISAVTGFTESVYLYASVPPDTSLYQDAVANSYQVIEQKNQSFMATGPQALVYNIPQNQYLVSLHLNGRDGNGVALDNRGSTNALTKIVLQYNAGAIIPVVMLPFMNRAEKYANYGADISDMPGYWLWDGEDTANSLVVTDNMGWVDCYNAATPQLVADVLSTVTLNGTFSTTRESVVAGSVQVVGG